MWSLNVNWELTNCHLIQLFFYHCWALKVLLSSTCYQYKQPCFIHDFSNDRKKHLDTLICVILISRGICWGLWLKACLSNCKCGCFSCHSLEYSKKSWFVVETHWNDLDQQLPVWSLTVETSQILLDPGCNPVVSLALSARDVSQLSQDYHPELTGS